MCFAILFFQLNFYRVACIIQSWPKFCHLSIKRNIKRENYYWIIGRDDQGTSGDFFIANNHIFDELWNQKARERKDAIPNPSTWSTNLACRSQKRMSLLHFIYLYNCLYNFVCFVNVFFLSYIFPVLFISQIVTNSMWI